MKKLLSVLLVLFFLFPSFADARSYRTKSSDVHVNGYYKKSWTYVNSYYRTPKDYTKKNNYSCIDYGRCY